MVQKCIYNIIELYFWYDFLLLVKVPSGGNFAEISKYESKIEKAYGCKCTIENIEKSEYVSVRLEY